MNSPHSAYNSLDNSGIRVKSGTRSNNVVPKNKKIKRKRAARKFASLCRKRNRRAS